MQARTGQQANGNSERAFVQTGKSGERVQPLSAGRGEESGVVRLRRGDIRQTDGPNAGRLDNTVTSLLQFAIEPLRLRERNELEYRSQPRGGVSRFAIGDTFGQTILFVCA
ncbi:hypothetical protein [Paenibacillus sp. 32O-W]|uniref:hypothetical protein n=1 Tax=Paenibacillus sp. 32O-W TaxID=1695218 RepID=UPI000781369B|nr:hypothetical protein [Paenibacillus sp. 32O-W]